MKNMMPKLLVSVMALTATGLVSAQASKSSHTGHGADHAGMNQVTVDGAAMSTMHSGHDMAGMSHGSMTKMSHGDMPGMDHGAMSGMDHSSMGDMNMQGGSAPVDAREPDGYSGGYAVGSGIYSLGENRQIRLADEHRFAAFLVDRLEQSQRSSSSNSISYDAQAWYGNTYDRLVIKAEGAVEDGKVSEARTELLWGHAIATFWDTQLGLRNDSGSGRPGRNWLAMGVQGLAPYWFEVDATAYVGSEGRTALRLSAEYDLLLTQRLILQPRVEANLYGKNDPALNIGSGLSDMAMGVRLRYEFSRQFAPYIGIEREQHFGNTAEMVQASGEPRGVTRAVAGIRMWF